MFNKLDAFMFNGENETTIWTIIWVSSAVIALLIGIFIGIVKRLLGQDV